MDRHVARVQADVVLDKQVTMCLDICDDARPYNVSGRLLILHNITGITVKYVLSQCAKLMRLSGQACQALELWSAIRRKRYASEPKIREKQS